MRAVCLVLMTMSIVIGGVCCAAGDRIIRKADGTVIIKPLAVARQFRNAWPDEEEKAFQRRANHIIRLFAEDHRDGGRYGNTFFENEKRSYPRAMFDLLAGNVEPAVAWLEREDNLKKDNAHTLGIDFWPCFTLKGQMRKYFFFGGYLHDDYRKKMFKAAKIWTGEDPLRRPHPVYGKGDRSKPGWMPKTWGSWVDIRNTDNLRAMRDTSVYLMAEETGNEKVRRIYKKKLAGYVAALYHVGMSEWDSENYHGHTIAPYLNLYDFAKDPETVATAKAALDWLTMAAAVKYYRGGFGGPNKRDYGKANVVFGAGASHISWLYFGDTPQPDPHIEYDTIHAITSAYRPPQAVVALARKQFDKPVTLQNTKPAYGTNYPGDVDKPTYWETVSYGNTYQLGSVVSEVSAEQKGLDVGPCKLLVENSRRGVDFVAINTAPADSKVEVVSNRKQKSDQITQHRHLGLWLRYDDKAGRQFVFQVPRSAEFERKSNAWFWQFEKTWLAVLPIRLGKPEARDITHKKRAEHYKDERMLVARTTTKGYSGFGMIVGEKATFGSYRRFRSAVETKVALDLDRLSKGIVELKEEHTGTRMKMFHNRHTDRAGLIRNGVDASWDEHYELYRPLGGKEGPVRLGWKDGTLRVKAGGHVFEQTVTADGQVEN